jgi:hypothetical protein
MWMQPTSPANIDISNNVQRSDYNNFINYYDPEASSEGEWIKTLVNRLENTEVVEKLGNLCVEPFLTGIPS